MSSSDWPVPRGRCAAGGPIGGRVCVHLRLASTAGTVPLNTIEYHWIPLDHSMVFQQDSMVFPMVICNTIQYHWTIQWYFSRLNGTLGYSMVFL